MEKSFSLKLKNGKEEKFETGAQMFNWYIQQVPNAIFETRQEKKEMRKQAKALETK